MKYKVKEFYPTPAGLLEKIMSGLDWRRIHTVLEPEAGKGDIADFIRKRHKTATYGNNLDLDCIELDSELRATLKGKGYRVVHDDFLTFRTLKKYDLIAMNPPFSNGASHLMRALDMQQNGGGIICILNAETIKNPYSNERKVLMKRLNDAKAEICFYQNEFVSSEHPTGVEIAVIKVFFEEPECKSFIYENLKQKTYAENTHGNMTDLAPNDYIEAMVAMYNLEVESGVKLIQEYRAMCPHILNDLRESNNYRKPILTMTLDGKELSVNQYVREVRKKYWSALFKSPKFMGQMTSNLADQHREQVHKLSDYDFSTYNIRCIQIEISKNLVKGIEDSIVNLFNELSYQYAYDDDLRNNIHYYNGWKTNKAWYINKKVIIPYMNAYNSWSGYHPDDYHLMEKLMDIEKALNYLDGGITDACDLKEALQRARETGQTKKIRLKYFYVTFYKKGTCHIEFISQELLKKLNIFGSQQKKWLPPGYGRKKYEEMSTDEKTVIDEFEGKESYKNTINNAEYFIYEPKSALPMLEAAAG